MFRLTKYQLLLKDLLGTCISTNQVGRIDLQDSLAAMLRVIRTVNDSLHQVNITHLPSLLNPLGSLICQVRFIHELTFKSTYLVFSIFAVSI